MQDSIFREYDIRGKVGSEFIIEEAYNLGCAIAVYFLQEKPDIKNVVLAMDGRVSSPVIKDEVARAFIESGFTITFIGVCPTPVLYFAEYTLPVDAGIMITASHNPQEYNGIKIVLNKNTIWGQQLQEIKKLYKQGCKKIASQKGTIQEYPLVSSYINYVVQHFPSLQNMQMEVVIDCGNGTAGIVLPELIKAMKWKNIHLLYPEVDGTYPHHEADPVIEENMADVKRLLQTTSASLGIGLDGDCDRMAAMTKSGYLIPGDQLLALFAQDILNQSPGAAVVFDIKSSAGLIELLNSWGAKASISPAGHAIIKEQMKRNKAVLGGELSCHFFFHDRYFGYDDGIYAMMRLFELLLSTDKDIALLLEVFPKKISTREIRLSCPEEKKQEIIDFVKNEFTKNRNLSLITIDGVRVTWPYGWAIIRASHTQPVLSIRFESDTQEGLLHIKKDFIGLLERYFDRNWLEKQFS